MQEFRYKHIRFKERIGKCVSSLRQQEAPSQKSVINPFLFIAAINDLENHTDANI